MPDILKPEDLFDFDAYARQINKMIQLNADFAKSSAAMAAHIKDAQKPVFTQLQNIINLIEKVNTSQKNNIDTLSKLEKEGQQYTNTLEKQRKLLSLLDGSYTSSEKSIAELKASLALLKSEYEKLDPKQKDFKTKQDEIAAKSKEVKASIEAQSAALKAATTTVNAAENSYSHLSKTTDELRKKLNSVPGSFDNIAGASHKANHGAESLHNTIQQNDRVLKDFDISLGENKKNLDDHSESIMGLVKAGFFGDGLGATILDWVLAGLEGIATTIIEFEKLDSSLKNATRSTEEFLDAQNAIENTALQNGQSVQGLTQSYTDLSNASRGTHLEGLATKKIFTEIANAGAGLKMSGEELNGVFAGMVSLMKDGSVDIEKLREQFGESLYQALLQTAEGLGINNEELTKILKEGRVLETDLLPKLAENFNKVYGSEAQGNLETISGSWEYLKTNVSLLIKAFNDDGRISKFFSYITVGIGNVLGDIKKALTDKDWLSFFGNIFTLGSPMFLSKKIIDSKGAPKKQETNTFEQDLSKFQVSPKKDREDAIKKYQDEIKKADSAIVQSHLDMVGQNKQQLIETGKTIEKHEKTRADLQKKLEQLQKSHGELLKSETTVKKPEGGKGKTKDDSSELERLEAINSRLNRIYADQIALKEQGKNYDKAKLAANEKELKANELIIKSIKEQINARGKTEQEKINDEIKKLNDILNEQVALKMQCENYDEQTIKNTVALIDCKKKLLEDIHKEVELYQLQKQLVTDIKEISSKKGEVSEAKVHFKDLAPSYSGDVAFDGNLNGIAGRAASQLEDASSSEKIVKIEKDIIQEIEDLKLKATTKGQKDRLALFEKEFKAKAELMAKDLKETEDSEKKKRKLTELYIEAGKQLATASFDFISALNKADIEKLETQKKHELELVGNNADAKAAIEKKFNAEILEIKRKQARVEKAQAAFNIGISTAQAIMKFLSDPGGVPGVVLSVAAGITGAIQLATVLAKPLPQFFKGTDNAPEGFALVAERGPELRETNGKMLYYDKPQLTWLHQGDKIHTAEQTSRILAQNQVNQELANHASQTRLMELRYINQFSSSPIDTRPIEKAIETSFGRMPIHVTQIDQNGFSEYTKSQNARTDYNRKRFSLPG